MSANSLRSALAVGLQADKDTAATVLQKAISLTSGANTEPEEREPDLEHPSPADRATDLKSPPEVTGLLSTITGTMRLRPRIIGWLLLLMGMKCSTTNNTTHYTHIFTIADDDELPWGSVTHLLSGATALHRLYKGVRGEGLEFTWDAANADANARLQALGLLEGLVAGSETFNDEVDIKLSPYTGTLTAKHGSTAVTTKIRSETFNIAQQLDRSGGMVLHSSTREGLDRLSFGVNGSIVGFDIDDNLFAWYKRVVYGSTGGTAATMTPQTGAYSFSYASAVNIPDAAVPYSMTVDMPDVLWRITVPESTGREIVRGTLNYRMLDRSADCLKITLVNDVATYALPGGGS